MNFAVVHLEAVEEHLRGYVGRYLCEVTTGFYVGTLTTRVSDRLWERLIQTSGRVVMVLPAPGEPGFRVRMHNVRDLELRDFDGLELLVRRQTPRSGSVLPA